MRTKKALMGFFDDVIFRFNSIQFRFNFIRIPV